MLGTGVTVFGVEGLEAAAAVGPAILHDVPLTPQDCLTFKATEVLHVPVSSFGLGAFISKNDLGEANTNVEQRGDLGGCQQPSCLLPIQLANFAANLSILHGKLLCLACGSLRKPIQRAQDQGRHRLQSVKAELTVTCS